MHADYDQIVKQLYDNIGINYTGEAPPGQEDADDQNDNDQENEED